MLVAGYVGFATLIEDSARRSILPLGRRGLARAAFADDPGAQLANSSTRPGSASSSDVWVGSVDAN